MLKNKNILVGITGGISAYKTCTLIRLYKKAGANVRVVLTPNALNFVTKLTLQTLSNNEVYVDNFEINEYKPEHIALSEADIFVIAPATANTIGKIANGICDNLLTTTACAFTKPFLLAPAMNNNMWNNCFVQENIKKLKNSGYNIIYPSKGFLACGSSDVGRMKEPEEIFEETVKILTNQHFSQDSGKLGETKQKLSGKKILITAGGTKEKIDPVRYISNNSSGKMGIAIANASVNMGADVTLVSTFPVEGVFKNIVTESANDMEKIVKENLFEQDCIIMSAAVADFRVKNYSEQKIKKGVKGVKGVNGVNEGVNGVSGEVNRAEEGLTLELVKNPDILKEISELKSHSEQEILQDKTLKTAEREESLKLLPIIVGFCAESENLIENAKLKIKNKGCDYIVANDISRKDIGFNSDENEVYIIDKNLKIKHLEKNTKQNIAYKILENIFE